jgi:hypothetical protein
MRKDPSLPVGAEIKSAERLTSGVSYTNTRAPSTALPSTSMTFPLRTAVSPDLAVEQRRQMKMTKKQRKQVRFSSVLIARCPLFFFSELSKTFTAEDAENARKILKYTRGYALDQQTKPESKANSHEDTKKKVKYSPLFFVISVALCENCFYFDFNVL